MLATHPFKSAISCLCGLSLLCCLGAAPALAETLVFGGADASGHRSTYGQLGVLAPLPGSELGNGWGVRAVVDGLTYQYNGAPGKVDGDAGGAQATVGYQSSGTPGWWSFFTGPTYRYTHLSPVDYTSNARGSNWGWIAQGEFERFLSRDLKVNAGANYIFANNDAFWSRLRVLYRLRGEMFIGPEGIYQGDGDYTAWQIGAGVFGIEVADRTQLGLKAGVRKVENLSASPYGGFELGRTF